MYIWTVKLIDKDGQEHWKHGLAGNYLAAAQKAREDCDVDIKEPRVVLVQCDGKQNF